jgi:uncharacterized membrane protein HdeD (DUF308 family)
VAIIIISYRREDTELMVGRICDRLRDHFGRDSVMMDIDSIPYGLDFRKHIKEALKRCDVMLAVMGPRWTAVSEDGRSRLADETDWIRIEIEAALAKDIPVIPVLVNGAAMPRPKDLPETMQDLAFRQAAPLDMRRDFHAHMDRLIGVMDELLKRGADAEQVAGERASAVHGQQAVAADRRAAVEKPEILAPAAPQAAQPARKPAQPPERSLLQRIFLPDAERREAQSRVLAANWWMVASRGVLTLLFGLVWLLSDSGYLNFLNAYSHVMMLSLLVFLWLDGALAIASAWHGATPKSRFLPLLMNGAVELMLAVWVTLERLGIVRVPTDASPWPAPEFWMDMGIGFMFAGALLLAASSGLSSRYGRVWLLAAGAAVVVAGIFITLISSSGDLAWLGDIVMIGAGALLFVLAIQLQARHLERKVAA